MIDALRPAPDETTKFFWDAVNRHELAIQRCRSCGHFMHVPAPLCRACLSTDLGHQTVSGRGSVYAFTICVQAFHPWFADKLPYALAVIDLEEQPGLKMVSNVVDCPIESVRSDMAVEVVFREVAPGLTLPLFRPRLDAPAAAGAR